MLKTIYINKLTNLSRRFMFLNIHCLYLNMMIRCNLHYSKASNIHYFVTKHLKANFVRKIIFFIFTPKVIAMTKQALYIASGILVLFSSVSCISGQGKNSKEFSTSKIYQKVPCTADTNLTYALFLPESYEKDKPCPVLILFDSHGDGLLPVNLFSAEASTNGFIVAGSNNSKNGLPIEETTAIYRKMLADISNRFNINNKAVYVGGFSGGSRVAGAAAITVGGIAGVVGCGAGLPNISQKPLSPFSYLAVVGNQDFNYTELLQLDETLEQSGYQHHLLEFDGIHQWPPKELIPEIFVWLKFDAMRQQAIPVDRNAINSFIEKNDKDASLASTEGRLSQQQDIYIKMMHYLHGLTDLAPLQAEIDKLSGNKYVVAFRKQQKQLLETEQELQRRYSPEIQQQSIEWWSKETRKLHSLSENPANPEMNAVYKRLLGFLSLNCYMYSTSALKQGDLEAAAKYIEIYRLVDPTNAEHRYLAAKVAAIEHNPDALFRALDQAFNLGFKDINRLQADADFQPYHQDERFMKFSERK